MSHLHAEDLPMRRTLESWYADLAKVAKARDSSIPGKFSLIAIVILASFMLMQFWYRYNQQVVMGKTMEDWCRFSVCFWHTFRGTGLPFCFCVLNVFKVTVYLQGCLTSKRCSASGLSCRYLNPYVKLKLIELAIKPYQKFRNKMKCWFFHGH